MRPWMSIHFLTFVVPLILTGPLYGATSTDVSPSEMTPAHPPKEAPRKSLEAEGVSITPVPLRGDENQNRIMATRTVRDRTIDLSAGLVSGPLREKEPVEQTQIYGLGVTSLLPMEAAQEYTLDLTENGLFGFHAQYKKYCCLGEWNEPYWTAGVSGLYDPAELLAGFIKIRNYQLQAGVGLEDLFQWKRRWRAELLVGAGTPGASVFLRLGYAFDESILNF